MAQQSKIEVTTHQDGDVFVVGFSGRLDAHSAPQAQGDLAETLQTHRKVLLDCTGVDFLSSAGLRTLVVAHRSMKEKNGRFAVHVPNSEVMETIRISGLDKIIAISSSHSEAMAHLND